MYNDRLRQFGSNEPSTRGIFKLAGYNGGMYKPRYVMNEES